MIKKSPLISVIMNARNSEKYLDECLRSLKTQSYKKMGISFFLIIVLPIILKKY